MAFALLPSPVVVALDGTGTRGLLTVIGTLVLVGGCFVLVSLLDRRASRPPHGATTSFADGGPGPDPGLGRWSWEHPRSEHDIATRRQTVRSTVAGVVGAVAVAAVLIPVRSSIGPASVALALVLVIVAAAASGGRVAAAATSAAAALAFNFLHAAPLYTFHLRNTADVVSSVLMVLVGAAVGEIAVRRFRTAWTGTSAPADQRR